MALINSGRLPSNVELQHFKNHSGRNAWANVAALTTIGRTEPGPQDVERTARALFGVDITEVEPNTHGAVQWPVGEGHIQLRDGTRVAVERSRHPDPHVEEVRWQMCEAELIQATGRGRPGSRSADNPLAITILTSVPLPIACDEAITWEDVQPALAQVMWARGAAPLNYRDMSMACPDLFVNGEAARQALRRENPVQTPIIYSSYLIGVCTGFSSIAYRRPGSRGPAGRLLYDAERIDPETWLAEPLGARVVL
jgi:hypothetical protein